MGENNSKILEASDEYLLAVSINKPKVFSVLVDRYQDAFLKKAEYIMKNREDAEDIVQETFTKIYIHAKRFEVVDGATFSSWAYKILMNTAFTYYAKAKKRNEAIFVPEWKFYTELKDSKQEGFGTYEIEDYVARIISRLPKTMGRILTLHFLQDLAQKEIAKLEGISVSAVKTRIYRAKKEFKKMKKSLRMV